MTGNIDDRANVDHSYYGNGCVLSWDDSKPTEGYGGSSTSCSTRIVATYDGENQKNGTLYHSKSTTAGSGGTLVEDDHAITPDSFCPLGWQLPYAGTGGDYYNKSRSWKYLLDSYGITASTLVNSRKILSYPMSHIASGYYGFALGRLFGQAINDRQFSSDNKTRLEIYRLNVDPYGTIAIEKIAKNFGYPLRCVNYFSIPHRRHGGRKSSEYDNSALSG